MSKESFAKLTEDLENLSKNDELKPVLEPIEEKKPEEAKPEEAKAEEVKPEEVKAEEVAPVIPEVTPEPETVKEVAPEAPVAPEEVEKAKKDDKDKDKDKGKDKDGDDDDKDADKEKAKDKDKKDDKPVKKSADEIAEVDFVGAFQAVVNSFSSVKDELTLVKSEFANFMTFVKENMVMKTPEAEVVTEEVAKSDVPAEETPVEEVSKSVEEVPEGKAVEFIAKSEDGLPEETPAEETPEPAPFVAKDHVSAVVNYVMKNANTMNQGKVTAIRQAVHRVKRGEEGQMDIDLFQEIVNFSENSEK